MIEMLFLFYFLGCIATVNLSESKTNLQTSYVCSEAQTYEHSSDPFLSSCKVYGNLMIGGILPMRQYKDRHGDDVDYSRCAGNLTGHYVIMSEAYLYYLKNASTDMMSHHGFSLGTSLIDSCISSLIGFQRSLHFIQTIHPNFCHTDKNYNISENFPVVLGGTSSEVALYVHRLLEVYCIPFFSIDSTSSYFSGRPFFIRITPPDNYQAEAIIEILTRFKWNHIGIVYQDTFYSQSLHRDITKQLMKSSRRLSDARKQLTVTGNFSRNNWTVCVEWSVELSVRQNDTRWTQLDNHLNDAKTPQVILVLLDIMKAKDFFYHLNKKYSKHNFQLIGVDGWATQIKKPFDVVNGSICTEPMIKPESAEFYNYLTSVTLDKALSPWFKELIEQTNNCCRPNKSYKNCSESRRCHGRERLNFLQIDDMQEALRFSERARVGVKILYETLANLHRDLCGSILGICENMTKINGSFLMNNLLNNPAFVKGTNNGPGNYLIHFFANNSWNHEVGNYTSHNQLLQIKQDIIQSSLGDRWNLIENHIGNCFSKCVGGYPKIPWSGSCCWSCKFCYNEHDNIRSIVHVANDSDPDPHCVACPAPTLPSSQSNFRKCITGHVYLISLKKFSIWFPLVPCCLGLLICGFCLVCFFLKQRSAILNASGQKSLIAIIVSAALTFVSVIVSLSVRFDPNPWICSPCWVFFGSVLTLDQTILFMKCKRLHHVNRDWNHGHYVSFLWYHTDSNIVTGICSGVIQVTFTAVWLFITFPKTSHFLNNDDGGYTIVCSPAIKRESMLLFIQPCFLILTSLAVLFKFQHSIKTCFTMLEQRYLMFSLIICAISVMLIMLPSVAISDVNGVYVLQWKFGSLSLGISLIGLAELFPVIRVMFLSIMISDNDAERYVDRQLDSIKQFNEMCRIQESELILTDASTIGCGHFAEVFKATQKIGNGRTRTVAVKKLKQSAGNPFEQRKFYEEGFVMSQLNHPNIVAFFGTCQTQSKHLLVMEYLNGGSLQDFFEEQRENPANTSLCIKDLIGFCKDVSAACKFMEARKFIHRDIKTGNCLLSTGQQMTVKLSDFGLAKDVHSMGSYQCSVTFLAPIRHTAPEGLKNHEFTLKSDVWSFGVLIWQVFHMGADPLAQFENREIYSVICERKQTVLDYDIGNIDGIEIPQELHDEMKKCLRYEQDGRPSFAEIHTRLCRMHAHRVRSTATSLLEWGIELPSVPVSQQVGDITTPAYTDENVTQRNCSYSQFSW